MCAVLLRSFPALRGGAARFVSYNPPMLLARRGALALPLLLALLAPAVHAEAAAPLDPDAFTRRLAAELRRAFPDRQVRVDEGLELRLVAKDGGEHLAFLSNAYAEYRQDPGNLDGVAARFVASIRSASAFSDAARPIARDRIVPTIKHLDWLAQAKKVAGAKAKPFATEPLTRELVVVYAEDTPENVRYLFAEETEKLGVRPAELRALAVKNLRALLPDVRVEDVRDGVHMVVADGNYEAALLLSDALVATLPAVDGELVVAIPSRDLFLFTGSENDAAVEALRGFAAKMSEEAPYSLTPSLFVRRGGKLVEF